MRRSLIISLGLIVVATVGVLLLAADWSAGSELETDWTGSHAASSTRSPTPTRTYTEVLTVAATDIWSLPTPAETPIIPTDRPRRRRSTPPTVPPRPTPTLLPDPGIRLLKPQENPREAGLPGMRIVGLDLDGHILALTVDHNDGVSVLLLDLETSDMRTVAEFSDANIQEPYLSEKIIVWSMSWRDGDRGVLHLHSLRSEATTTIADHVYNYGATSHAIVWSELGDRWDIVGFDLDQQKPFSVVQRPGSQTGARPSGPWIVYQDAAGRDQDEADLRVVNVDTGEDTHLGAVFSPSDQYVPQLYAIDAPNVVWSSEAALHIYDLAERTATTVTIDACIQAFSAPFEGSRRSKPGHVRVSGNTVIFFCGQYLGYDIERGALFSLPIVTVASPDSGLVAWDIDGNRLVWAFNQDPYGPDQTARIFTARIQRDP